jgi:hypothetical protein
MAKLVNSFTENVQMAILQNALSKFKQLKKDRSGNTTTLFALSAVALIGGAGVAIDFAQSNYKQTQVQANLDAAVLAGVASSLQHDHQILMAKKFFDEFENSSGTSYGAEFSIKNELLVGRVSATIPSSFSRVLGIETVPFVADSTATSGETLEPACFMAMHPTRKHTLELKETVRVIAPDCNIYGNSNHFNDVVDPHTPENYLEGKFIAAIGGGHHYLENVKPPVEFGTRLVPDPFGAINIPAPGPCTQTNFIASAQIMDLPQGHYCGGLTITNGSKVKLQTGGTYFISGGTFKVNSSTVEGEGVTIFLTDGNANVEWNKAVVRISAPKAGPFAGTAVFGERVATNNSFTESTVDVHGAFYMPMGAFTWENVGEPDITAKWQAFILDGVSWIGSGTIRYTFDLANSDIPFPTELISVPRPGEVRLIK